MISKLESGKYNPTLSTEMFKSILQEIINSLNKFDDVQFTTNTNDK